MLCRKLTDDPNGLPVILVAHELLPYAAALLYDKITGHTYLYVQHQSSTQSKSTTYYSTDLV